jgi:hypothetical protein
MRVGILDVLALPARRLADTAYQLLLTKQFASVTPQAVSVWCRQLGHQTFYATYYGVGDPRRLLPADLDVLFIACYTQASALAYALAKLYRQAGARTVIGGPHAKSFPADCLRFFDLVVQECDKRLIADILAGHYDPGSLLSSVTPFADLPTVEERLPEIRASAFLGGRRPIFSTTVPMLASMGCPYTCDFCVDWSTPYRLLSRDRLTMDLRYLAQHMPGVLMAFHDPNFAVKFDQVLDVLATVPPPSRIAYIMESSLTILRGSRAKRLQETNCVVVAPGIESWMDYANKAGAGWQVGLKKVERTVEHFQLLHEYVPYLQANLMFGLDTDSGEDPIALTQRFMDCTPFVWPALNIPVPFGGTPLYQHYLATGRILQAMPFSFYYAPYVVTTLKNYDPVTYYEQLITLFSHATCTAMLRRRLASTSSWLIKLFHWVRTASTRAALKGYYLILERLRSDPQVRAFHEGQTAVLPEFYHHEYERMLGPYGPLLSRADRTPYLEGV